ncbi:MAG: cytidine deaminase [Acholeplasmataceae bacterium]
MKLKEAKLAREKAFVPYSNFKVGASIKLKDGTIIHGANIENMSYSLTICAERSALFSLISQGYNPNDIESITIIGDTKDPISPCGACRQVMFELMPKTSKIYLANLKGDIKETNINELLPYGFDFDE